MRTVPDDQIWDRIRSEAIADAAAEPALAGFLNTVVLGHSSLEDALSYLLAAKLESPVLTAMTLRDLIEPVFCHEGPVRDAIRADLQAVLERDPATRGYSQPLLYFKGFHAIQSYRVAHHYWTTGRVPLALFLQSRISEVFAVDIHPRRAHRQGDHVRPRHVRGDRRDGRGRGRLLDAARGHPRRHRQGRRRPAPQDRTRRHDRRRRQGAGQHPGRRGRQDRRRVGGPARRCRRTRRSPASPRSPCRCRPCPSRPWRWTRPSTAPRSRSTSTTTTSTPPSEERAAS